MTETRVNERGGQHAYTRSIGRGNDSQAHPCSTTSNPIGSSPTGHKLWNHSKRLRSRSSLGSGVNLSEGSARRGEEDEAENEMGRKGR